MLPSAGSVAGGLASTAALGVINRLTSSEPEKHHVASRDDHHESHVDARAVTHQTINDHSTTIHVGDQEDLHRLKTLGQNHLDQN